MRISLLFAILGLLTLSALAVEPSAYQIVLSNITDNNGNFDLVFRRVLPGGGKQTIYLTDNDGVATLSAVQLAIIDKVRDTMATKGLLQKDPTLEELFTKSELDQMQLLRNYALKRVEKSLRELIDSGSAHATIGAKSGKTVNQLYTDVRSLLYGPFPRHHLKLSEIEAQNAIVNDLSWAGGPYTATYDQEGQLTTYRDIVLKDPKDGTNNFLGGAIAHGMYRFNGGYSKSHVFLAADTSGLFTRYQNSLNAKQVPRGHQ